MRDYDPIEHGARHSEEFAVFLILVLSVAAGIGLGKLLFG